MVHFMIFVFALVLLPKSIKNWPVDKEELKEDVTIRLTPEHFHPIESLFHSQDKTGHYIYGYATPTANFQETRTSDGATHGGYSYIDKNGILQTVHYTADPLHGFRVAASNLPVESEDISLARYAHLQAVEATKEKLLEAAKLHQVAYSNPISVPFGDVNKQVQNPVTDLPEVQQAREEHLAILKLTYLNQLKALQTLPQPVQEPPEIIKARREHLAKVTAVKLNHEKLIAEIAALNPSIEENGEHVIPVQLGKEDGVSIAPDAQLAYAPVQYGPYSYGYVEPFSSKSEVQSSDGTVTGGYSYIDAAGILQTVKYTADKNGFRVDATNIPVDKNHLNLKNAVRQKDFPESINILKPKVPIAIVDGKGALTKTEILY